MFAFFTFSRDSENSIFQTSLNFSTCWSSSFSIDAYTWTYVQKEKKRNIRDGLNCRLEPITTNVKWEMHLCLQEGLMQCRKANRVDARGLRVTEASSPRPSRHLWSAGRYGAGANNQWRAGYGAREFIPAGTAIWDRVQRLWKFVDASKYMATHLPLSVKNW